MNTVPPHAQDGNPSFFPDAPGIYKITCTANGKIYIGSATNLRKRLYEHFRTLRHGTHHNSYLQRAFNKYGENAFTTDVLDLVLLPEMLTAREQYWFAKLKPFGKRGFNLAREAGSQLGIKHSPESIEKTRQANRGNTYNLGKKRTLESCQRMRDSHLGKSSTFKGKHHTPESIVRIKEARSRQTSTRKGVKQPLEAIEKTRQANTGRKQTPEAIEKKRQASIGKERTPEQIKRFQQSQRESRASRISTSSTGLRGVSVYEEKRIDRKKCFKYRFTCQCTGCKVKKSFPYTEEGLAAARAFAEAHYAAIKE